MTAIRFIRPLLALSLCCALFVGCTIIAQPDRSKIDNNSDDGGSTAGQGGTTNDDTSGAGGAGN